MGWNNKKSAAKRIDEWLSKILRAVEATVKNSSDHRTNYKYIINEQLKQQLEGEFKKWAAGFRL
ncbi:hypothetical protein BIY23_01130 [Wolbachia pipientis]|uniref:Uncharacterized protein n=1 Tax=Wolbachia pipientis TaxID=955 RepID=A0A1E7QKU9_WOLPI|nr:hypothetical protein [Wolbachia pipientis]OEY87073.1 hypothetical protein BIY23_01130 [Wolbachia pipientis]